MVLREGHLEDVINVESLDTLPESVLTQNPRKVSGLFVTVHKDGDSVWNCGTVD